MGTSNYVQTPKRLFFFLFGTSSSSGNMIMENLAKNLKKNQKKTIFDDKILPKPQETPRERTKT